VASPRYDNNKGNPFIQPGSNQDVDVGILEANVGGGNGSEEHPSFSQTYLDFASSQKITGTKPTTQPDGTTINVPIQVPLSFWYSATGHSNQDTFMTHGGFFSSSRINIDSPTISKGTAPTFLPLAAPIACSTASIKTPCTIISAITNRTGHTVHWTVTLLDKNTGQPVTPIKEGDISGIPGQENLDYANIDLPPAIALFPTYILDVKVVDPSTAWSTERQAYVTSGIQIILPPIP